MPIEIEAEGLKLVTGSISMSDYFTHFKNVYQVHHVYTTATPITKPERSQTAKGLRRDLRPFDLRPAAGRMGEKVSSCRSVKGRSYDGQQMSAYELLM